MARRVRPAPPRQPPVAPGRGAGTVSPPRTVVDLAPAPVALSRLPSRRRVSEAIYQQLLTTDPVLRPLRSPETTCTVDVSVVNGTAQHRWVQVHSRQGRRGDRVASASSAGRGVEV